MLREAAVWRLVSVLFECPTPKWLDQVTALAGEIGEPALTAAAEAARREATPELYHSTFGPGGPAAPREVSHQRHVLAGTLLGEICSLYDAFGYRPRVDEPPDHIAVEAGFVAYLHLKRAYALARGDQERSELCAEVARRFIREHVSRIAEPLTGSLACSSIAYLAGAAEVLRSRVGAAPVDRLLEGATLTYVRVSFPSRGLQPGQSRVSDDPAGRAMTGPALLAGAPACLSGRQVRCGGSPSHAHEDEDE